MHLTNYAINKKSKNFVKGEGEDDDSASKRSIASVMKSLEDEYGVKKEVIWDSIKDIIIKTVLSAQPELNHIYKSSQ
jgi:tubulin polyglutamylase TTLL6/13